MTTVYLPGDNVTLWDKNPARVLIVNITAAGVASYKVAWWQGAQRHEAWVEPCEIIDGTPYTLKLLPVDKS